MPAKAVCQSIHVLAAPPLSQASQLPHIDLRQALEMAAPPIPCGSGLAREGGVSVDTRAGCSPAIAGKPAPTL
ncbi:hypothetical protein DBR46_12275 [Pseudomonas sp. KBW05]|nr:hypothetical protein DBR46_12275 [Pseudomonas sp. KBW05]